MAFFLISDTHFGHKNILDYENRPFSCLSEMREQLIINWNSVVGPEDTVFHLGDVMMGNKEQAAEIISRLNGHKILIKGNHDQHGVQWFLDVGFEEVCKNKLFEYAGHTILMTHHPDTIPEGCEGGYDLHFYGHVHGKGNEPGKYPTFARNGACVCIERINYKPISLNEVIERCKNAPYSYREVYIQLDKKEN